MSERSNDTVGAVRWRRIAATTFGGIAAVLVAWAVTAAGADGFDRPVVSVALGLALIGANLAPVVTVDGGRLDAFTPVGALLVPIGLLLPLPEAVVVYALGEGVGVLAAHRFDRHVGGPEDGATVRTTFVVGKSIVGAVLGILAMRAVAVGDASVPAQVAAAFVAVTVSTAFDRTAVASLTAAVGRGGVIEHLRRGLGELTLVATAEVVAGSLIAVLASRDPWSLVLGLAMLGLLMVAASAYAAAATDRADNRELLRLAEELQGATDVVSVEARLLETVRRLLPRDHATLRDDPPGPDERGWDLSGEGLADRWLVTPRIVATRDYEEQRAGSVTVAASLAQVALERAAAREVIARQDRLRALLLSTVAHDLRGPLGVTRGALELLSEHPERLGDERRASLLEAASRGVARIDRLVDDLLDLDAVEEAARQSERCVLGETVRSLVADLDAASAQPAAPVVLEDDGVAAAIGRVALERIVENLVANARKYAPADSVVRVACQAEAGGAAIVVSDEGPGVEPDDRELIFEPFEQGSHQRGGVGLGLYVARRFVELHGGRIWVEEAATGGAAFHVWLPADVAVDRSEAMASAAATVAAPSA